MPCQGKKPLKKPTEGVGEDTSTATIHLHDVQRLRPLSLALTTPAEKPQAESTLENSKRDMARRCLNYDLPLRLLFALEKLVLSPCPPSRAFGLFSNFHQDCIFGSYLMSAMST